MNDMGHRKHIGRVALAVLGLGVLLSGCMETVQPASDANLTPLDRRLLANAPYARATISEQYQRHIVEYPRREAPGTIVVDTDSRYLYYVLPEGKAIRYGVTVGEEAMAWSGVAKVGRLAEWPSWTPTPEIKQRMHVPNYVSPGPQNPMGARALYCSRATRTPFTASTVPTSRNISAMRFPLGVSA
jgi:lipoprotein-anchoring transpeptidase ErfK/SrfK